MKTQVLVALVAAVPLVACTGSDHVAASVGATSAATSAVSVATSGHRWYADASTAVSHDCRAVWVGELLTTAHGLKVEWRQRRHHDPDTDTVWLASIMQREHRYRVGKCHDVGPLDTAH